MQNPGHLRVATMGGHQGLEDLEKIWSQDWYAYVFSGN